MKCHLLKMYAEKAVDVDEFLMCSEAAVAQTD